MPAKPLIRIFISSSGDVEEERVMSLQDADSDRPKLMGEERTQPGGEG